MSNETTQETKSETTQSEQSTQSTSVPMTDVSLNLQYLTDQYNDENWRKATDSKLVEAVGIALTIINKLSNDTGELLGFFYEYVGKVSSSPLVAIGSDSDVSNAPTQTFGNRATRRTRTRAKK